MKELGLNAIRIRVWVDPSDNWCNTADVVVKAQRAKALNMDVMIDFHYSDWWADPAQQNKPAAWVGKNLADLKKSSQRPYGECASGTEGGRCHSQMGASGQ